MALKGTALLTVALAASVELGYSRSVTPGLIAHYERRHGSVNQRGIRTPLMTVDRAFFPLFAKGSVAATISPD